MFSPTERVNLALFDQYGVDVAIKRDDLLHPIVSGNKWRKSYFLRTAMSEKNCQHLVTMGGQWSNHLHAMAYWAKEHGIKATAFVRAHAGQEKTQTLLDCEAWGMEIVYVDREAYRKLRDKTAWNAFAENYPHSYWLPEGGMSAGAIDGVALIGQECTSSIERTVATKSTLGTNYTSYDWVFTGCGSGATLLGLAKGFPASQVVGVAAFKGASYLNDELSMVGRELNIPNNWSIAEEYHCGGFAKSNEALRATVDELESQNSFKLDQVYNAKTFMALMDYVRSGRIVKGQNVLVLHTGGLQGNRS